MEGLEVRGRGPGLHSHSLNPTFRHPGKGDKGPRLRPTYGGGACQGTASQTVDSERRAHGKWDRLDVRASLPGRVHAERMKRPMKPLGLQDCDPALCLPAEINEGPVLSQNLSIQSVSSRAPALQDFSRTGPGSCENSSREPRTQCAPQGLQRTRWWVGEC